MIDDANFLVLQKMLDAAVLRHKVIAQNMANVETRGYRRRMVDFKDALAQAVASGEAERLQALKPRVGVSDQGVDPLTDNNVTLEREFADLMENALFFQTTTRLLSARLAAYRAAISGQSSRG